MKKIIHRMVAGLLFLLLLSPDSAQAQGLTFSISLNKTVYTVGEPIVCTMTLKNTGTTALVVNNRFLVNFPMGPHEVSFQVIDPALRPVLFDPFVNSKFDSDLFVMLSPGSTETITCDLTEYFPWPTLGKYSITGFYENNTDPPASLGLPSAWKGRLKSNKASITLN